MLSNCKGKHAISSLRVLKVCGTELVMHDVLNREIPTLQDIAVSGLRVKERSANSTGACC